MLTTAEACKEADVIMVLLPDTEQARVYREDIEPNLDERDSLAFAHGFNIHFGQITPPKGVDVWMIAPKGPGHLVRRTFEEGGGVPALVAVSADETGKAKQTALAYARRSARTRAGVLDTTFEEETETDLFGEQVVLCGGLVELIKASYETLVDAGYQPESAYFETLHEVKLIVDLIYEGGIANMRYSISDTAEYGDMTRGPRIVTDDTRAEMQQILDEIQSGKFAQEWILENQAGRPVFNALRKQVGRAPDRRGRRAPALDDAVDRCRARPSRATSPAGRTLTARAVPGAACDGEAVSLARRLGVRPRVRRAADHRRGVDRVRDRHVPVGRPGGAPRRRAGRSTCAAAGSGNPGGLNAMRVARQEVGPARHRARHGQGRARRRRRPGDR